MADLALGGQSARKSGYSGFILGDVRGGLHALGQVEMVWGRLALFREVSWFGEAFMVWGGVVWFGAGFFSLGQDCMV
jgi:hypothetical protein